jgi:hypothetical protein
VFSGEAQRPGDCTRDTDLNRILVQRSPLITERLPMTRRWEETVRILPTRPVDKRRLPRCRTRTEEHSEARTCKHAD